MTTLDNNFTDLSNTDKTRLAARLVMEVGHDLSEQNEKCGACGHHHFGSAEMDDLYEWIVRVSKQLTTIAGKLEKR